MRDDGQIIIEYGAREVLAGYRLYLWQPFYLHNGRYVDLSLGRALDTREDALRVSEVAARENAEHYRGDWSVTVRRAA